MDDALNSLEEWVAVKPNLFAKDASNCKIRFYVAWNEQEQKLGVTCSQGSRTVSDKTATSLATSLSLQSLTDIHKQLSLVHHNLEAYFPTLPNTSSSKSSLIPNLFFGQKQISLDDNICRQVEEYLEIALNVCGKRLLLSLLFDEHPLSDFEENLQELRLKGHENVYKNAYIELEEVLKLRKRAENMIEMSTVYAIEDEVVTNVSIALAELYNFQIQPFLQLREISYNCLNAAENILKDNNLGGRRKDEARREIEEHNHQYLAANEALQHLYQQYYRNTSELVANQVDRLLVDKGRFGRSAFDVAGGHNRLLRLQVFQCQERLKLLNAIKLSRECQKHQIQQEMKKGIAAEDAERVESEICEAQISILDAKLEILTEEESLLKKQIEVLKNNDAMSVDDELFYDAVEDLKDLIGDEQRSPNRVEDPQIDSLKAKLQEVFRKRANIRNRRKVLVSQRDEKKKQKEANKTTSTRNATKRNEKSVDSKKNEEYLRNARLRTLQRLRLYRQKTQKNLQPKCSKVARFLDETGNELPPYPNFEPISDENIDIPFPLPPEDFSNNCLMNRSVADTIKNSNVPQSGALFPPLAPPPPPPPPPPSTLFSPFSPPSFNDQLKNLKITKRTEPTKSPSNLIDLNEILNVKKTLKTFVPLDKKENESCDSDFHAALNQMRRKIAFEPDTSEEDDRSDSDGSFE